MPPFFCRRKGLHLPTQAPCGRYRGSRGYGRCRASTSAEAILPFGDSGPTPRLRGTGIMDVVVVTNDGSEKRIAQTFFT